MEYRDFVIRIGPVLEEGCQVLVDSPAGEASGVFRLPFSRQVLEANLRGWPGPTFDCDSTPAREFRDLKHPANAREWIAVSPKKMGKCLFHFLITERIRDLFVVSLSEGHSTRLGLRIMLKFNPEDPDFEMLNGLPWELLYREERREFLSLSRFTPIVRHLEVDQPAHPRPVLPSPLRILVVGAGPADQIVLDLAEETRSLAEAWHGKKHVDFEVLQKADLESLRQALLAREFHVLHFMGHGTFDESEREGLLFFVEEDGRSRAVSAEELVNELRDFKTLRVVFLNACKTAQVASGPGDDPFRGLAPALLQSGVPALLAMRSPIADQAAITFSGAFYRRLAAGDPIDTAIVEGRLAVYRMDKSQCDWATPVLYLRMEDGQLFEPSPALANFADEISDWNPHGVAILLLGLLGIASLVGLLCLQAWDDPPLRYAMTAIGATMAASLGGLGWKKEDFARKLTHFFSRHRYWQVASLIVALAAVVGWPTLGSQKLCDLRCAPLGCTPPNMRRLVIEPFEGPDSELAESFREALREKLTHVGALEILSPDGGTDLPCVDVRVRGELGRIGTSDRFGLKVQVTDGAGFFLGRLQVPDAAESSRNDSTEKEDRLISWLLPKLGVEVGPALRERILETPTDDPEALSFNNEGVRRFQSGEVDAAEASFFLAQRLDSTYPSALNNLGRIKLYRKDHKAAEEFFLQAISLLPRNPIYHFNLGLALDYQGRNIDSASAYQKALELDPTFALAHNNLGYLFQRMGMYRKARESLQMGLLLTGDDGQLRATLKKNLGLVALGRGDTEEALSNLGEAVGLYPDFAEALFYLAVAQEKSGQRAQACQSWKRYASIAHDDEDRNRPEKGKQRQRQLGCREIEHAG